MNLAMYNLPSNLKSSLHKTWQTLLLFLKPLQIQTLKRKKWGTWHIISPHLKKWGIRLPYSPPNCAHVTNHDFGPDYKQHQPKLHGSPPSKYTLYWTFCHRSRFLSNLRLPWKNRVALKIFTVLNILFTFRSFEQLACACPEKQRVPWIHSTDYIFFIIQDFWATSAFPEKQSFPDIFHCIKHVFFIIQEFWGTRACPEKK